MIFIQTLPNININFYILALKMRENQLPVSRFYQDLAPYYDFICTAEERKKDVAVLNQLIKRHKKSRGNMLLDVACGTGLEDKYLKRDFKVMGLDLNPGVLEIAKKRNPDIVYKIGDMRKLTLGRKFDVITCFDAMCYLRSHQEMKTTLRNFYNHLHPGGVLIFYIDDNFLKEHTKQDITIITNNKKKNGLNVTLIEIYHRIGKMVEGYTIYLIRKSGKVRMEVDIFEKLGFFEVKKIKDFLRTLGFKFYLYRTGKIRTFSTKKYSKKGPAPIFVCAK